MAGRNRIRIGWPFGKLRRHPLLGAVADTLVPDGAPLHAGWGLRPSGRAALAASRRSGNALALLEDAFVRSLRPGGGGPVYGVIADSRGIHYAPAGGSDLLDFLDTGVASGWIGGGTGENPVELMARFREIGASKYNWFPGEFSGDPLPAETGILVVDQSRGDASIRAGGLAVADFSRMLRDALDEADGAPVYVRAHPDHIYRKKHSCFPAALLEDARIRLLPPDLSPAQCFSFCHTVMVGSSLVGMEALIHGKKVVTYGQPFFAGRGLTVDRAEAMPARRAASLETVFDAAYLRYSRYFQPDTREPCGLGEILDHIALQKEMFRKNRGLSVTAGFSPWKRGIVPRYLRSPAGQVRQFAEAPPAAEFPGARLLVWGRSAEIPAGWRGRAVRVEDGFLRSKGLGAAFNFPYSWVLDTRGIYFDGGAPSDLEEIYRTGIAAAGAASAGELIEMLRKMRLTKYNLTGERVALDRAAVAGRKTILVPGQVEADASIQFGSPDVKTNLALLRRVRAAEPEAYLIFTPHPDLVAGARHGELMPGGHAEIADLAVTHGNVLDWLDLCDEVHTITSTVGFEALIRKVPVVTYGMPFYAGWGLTTDRLSCPRRTRRLTLEELVCGALIEYPRYLNPATGEFTTAMKVAELLTSETAAGDERAWHLKMVSQLKKLWVRSARKPISG
jgi:capsular polysaccharide export protein